VARWLTHHSWTLNSTYSQSQSESESESELLYDWWFTANQFVLAPSPLRLTTRDFFPLNPCINRHYVTSPLKRGRVCRLQLLLALAIAVILGSKSRGTHNHILPSQIRDSPRTWRARSPYLYSPGTWCSSYTPRHWVTFSSPPTTRRPTVELYEPASTRANSNSTCSADCLGAGNVENTASVLLRRVYRGHVFTEQLLRNGFLNPVVLLLRVCMLRALHSNGRCLQSHGLATGMYTTILITLRGTKF
jgi:hypothetical protein